MVVNSEMEHKPKKMLKVNTYVVLDFDFVYCFAAVLQSTLYM